MFYCIFFFTESILLYNANDQNSDFIILKGKTISDGKQSKQDWHRSMYSNCKPVVDSVEMFWYATSKTKNQKQNKPAQKTLQKLQQQQKTKNPNHMIMINKRMNQIVTIV